ncbi:MAG: hypothetical protein KDD52_03830 [Bdellovibrionales bacterium]|nr:hypothetical protein [Bdellovibrionales bacterium]
MSQKNKNVSPLAWIPVTCLIAACSTSNIGTQSLSTFESSEDIVFSKEHLKQTLTTFSQTMTYVSPNPVLLQNIESAANLDDARQAYEQGVEDVIDNFDNLPNLKERMMDYFIAILGVGEKGGTLEENIPALLFTWTVLNDNPIEDALLKDDGAYNGDGNLVAMSKPSGMPASEASGYATSVAFLDEYSEQFKFRLSRELWAHNLCDVAPWSKLNISKWNSTMIHDKYKDQTQTTGINCATCHTVSAVSRFAFRKLDSDNNYVSNMARGNNFYGMEDSSYGGEPRHSDGSAMTESESLPHYKLFSGGQIMDSPKVFMEAIVDHERFPLCWSLRLITILLDRNIGQPGQSVAVPDDGSGNKAEEAFVQKWAETFNENGRRPLSFIKQFAKSNDYIAHNSPKEGI